MIKAYINNQELSADALDYPFFQEVIKNAENENYKIDFLSSFFAEQIFSTYVNTKSADKWIIRKLTKIDNDGKEVFINDEVQQMD